MGCGASGARSGVADPKALPAAAAATSGSSSAPAPAEALPQPKPVAASVADTPLSPLSLTEVSSSPSLEAVPPPAQSAAAQPPPAQPGPSLPGSVESHPDEITPCPYAVFRLEPHRSDARALLLQQKSQDLWAAYDGVFELMVVRKGWREVPFDRFGSRGPFNVAAEVVVLVRESLDLRRGGGFLLRQLEGSSMDFLWGWDKERPLGEVETDYEFTKGVISSTFKDAHGYVEGLLEPELMWWTSLHPAFREAASATPLVSPQASAAAAVSLGMD